MLVEISKGCFIPKEFAEEILALREEEAHEKEWEEKTRKWLSDPNNRNDVNYSDIYKELYGHRPMNV